MDWVQHGILWHVYPLGALGAPIREGDDIESTSNLRDLTKWLDYAVELGASGVLLGPIFKSTSHGYDTLDQFKIDPRLGTDEDFTAFIGAAKKRGLKVVLDGVFSHVGEEDPRVVDALENGPDSQFGSLFDINWEAPGGPHPAVFEGHGSLVRLNHDDEGARAYSADVLNYWLDRGIDGWRLDAAYSVSTGFWKDVIGRVRERHPDAWFLGEVIHGDYGGFIEASGIDTLTQYMLWKAIWSSIKDKNLFELDWALKQHNELLAQFVPNTFVGNHDVTRIATQIGEEGALLALVIMMTIGGVPSIYYGDEQAYAGVKEERIGGDDDVRPKLPDTPAEFSPLGATMHAAHQQLIGIRRRNPWLFDAQTAAVELTNTAMVYESREHKGDRSLRVELNVEGVPRARVFENGSIWEF